MEAKRFNNALREMFTVSKEKIRKRESEWRQARARKKRADKRPGRLVQ